LRNLVRSKIKRRTRYKTIRKPLGLPPRQTEQGTNNFLSGLPATKNMKIRRIKKSDLGDCTKIAIKELSKKPYFEKWTNRTYYLRLKEIFDVSPKSCLCVKDKNKIIGFIFCRMVTWYDGKHANIEEMVINSKYQGKGIGKKLLLELEKILKKNKVVQADLISNKKSKAYKFFHERGYRLCDWDYLIKRI